MQSQGLIKFMYVAGSGSEARVDVELRDGFPGIGGLVNTLSGVKTAFRQEHNLIPKSGHTMFLRHMLVKKFEDFFYRKQVYRYPHIPRPLGSISDEGVEGYYYEYAFGREAFPWFAQEKSGHLLRIILDEWNIFADSFFSVGIDVSHDVADADNGNVTQNLIHEHFGPQTTSDFLSCDWKRIDFGFRSLPIDFGKMERYVNAHEGELNTYLSAHRLAMIKYAIQYLTNAESMPPEKKGRLEILVVDYRASSLAHFSSGFAGLSMGPARINGIGQPL